MASSREVLATLAETHVAGIDSLDREIVLRRLAGEDMGRVASAMLLSKSSAYRRAEAVFVKAFARAGLEPSHQLEGAWCVLHIRCCLSAATSQQESLQE
jgi:hypothetical protein